MPKTQRGVSSCKNCGKSLVNKEGPGRNRRWCESVPCKSAQRRQDQERYTKRAKVRGVVRSQTVFTRTCAQCAAVFQTKNYRARSCGPECGKTIFLKAMEARRVRLVPLRKIGSNYRRRARYYGVPYEKVDAGFVFERDGWRCQICGDKTPARLRGTTDPKSPELDHRIPMSRGGSHSYDNVQVACRECNARKGFRNSAGQTTLFPNPSKEEIYHAARRPPGELRRLASRKRKEAARVGAAQGGDRSRSKRPQPIGILAFFGE